MYHKSFLHSLITARDTLPKPKNQKKKHTKQTKTRNLRQFPPQTLHQQKTTMVEGIANLIHPINPIARWRHPVGSGMPGMTRSLLQGEIHSKPKVQNGNLMIKFGMESYDKSQLWVLEKETFFWKSSTILTFFGACMMWNILFHISSWYWMAGYSNKESWLKKNMQLLGAWLRVTHRKHYIYIYIYITITHSRPKKKFTWQNHVRANVSPNGNLKIQRTWPQLVPSEATLGYSCY